MISMSHVIMYKPRETIDAEFLVINEDWTGLHIAAYINRAEFPQKKLE